MTPSSGKLDCIGKPEWKRLFSPSFLTLLLVGTVSLALCIEQPFSRALLAQSETEGGLHVLEYHFCEVPTETVHVDSDAIDLYYHAHIILSSWDGELHETSLNITDVVDMPSTGGTGVYDLQPLPTSNGPDWFYWGIGTLQETVYFDDMFHIQWGDRERTTLESLGFSMSRNLTTHEIPVENDSVNQTIFIEIRPVERDKVLWVGADYMGQLIWTDLLEYNYKEYLNDPSPFHPYHGAIEWRIDPPLKDSYMFQATFKLTRKPGVTGTIEVFPRFRGDLRSQAWENVTSANSVSKSFEVGNLRMANRDRVDWTIGHEKSRTVFFTPLEAAVQDLIISSSSGGSVILPGEGTFRCDQGTRVNLVAEAEEGHHFLTWIGDTNGIADVNDPTTTVTMNGDYSITANFEEIRKYTLTISAIGGSVTTPGEGDFTYEEGTLVSLEAISEDGYQFVQWTGDVDTIADVEAASTTVIMDDDYSITANFEAAGGCFIATAAYGTPMAEELQILRDFRNEYLLPNPLGQAFVDIYYTTSPPIADFITEHPSLKPIVRAGLMPVVALCSVLLDIVPQFAGNEA